jgi:hypothetical protein
MDAGYDVFVSYSHSDFEWVTGFLLPRLEAAGLSACVDYRDFAIGLPAVENMARAVEISRKVLLVLTPAWIASEWTAFESLLSQTLDPSGLRQKTVPLLLSECSLPLRLRFLTYADFRKPLQWDSEFRRVLAELSTT